jgi:heme-degrading monooxygenase HmoA
MKMYARLVQFKMGPGTRSTADGLREQFAQALKESEGLVNVYFLGDDETGTYCSLAVWETKADGEAAFNRINPKLKEALGNLVEEPPKSYYFEVHEVVEPVH